MIVLLSKKTIVGVICIAFISLYISFLYSEFYTIIELSEPTTVPGNKDKVTIINEDLVKNAAHIKGGESIVTHKGSLVTGTLDGLLVGFDKESLSVTWSVPCPPSKQGRACRILGLRAVDDVIYGVDEQGRLLEFRDNKLTWLLDEENNVVRDVKPGFFNDLVIVDDMIYITDSFVQHPTYHPLQRFFSFENSGRVIGYNLRTRELSVVADGLYLPNGIELNYDNKSLLVSECSMFRVIRVDIDTGAISTFVSSTFGAVDNIRRSNDGGFWLGLSATRFTSSSLPDFLASYPTLRYVLTNKILLPLLLIYDKMFGLGPAFYKIDSEGNTVKLYMDPNKLTNTIALSEVCDLGDRIFVGTPFSPKVFVFSGLA